MKTLKFLTLIAIVSFGLYSFTSIVQTPWKVPEKYVSMKNPISPKVDANIGKILFATHCKACHGAKGLGDGPKANDLKGDLGDMTSAAFQKQTDGEIFYKITTGRDDMPNFEKKLKSAEDRWLIVNYVRTLKK